MNGADVAATDLNGDGNVDLALAVLDQGIVEVVLGNGDGTFQPVTSYSTGGSGNESAAATVNAVDMNGDGFPDLVIGSNRTAILLGNGSGGFAPAALYSFGGSFARPGYLNRDKVPDLVGSALNVGPSVANIAVAFGRAHGTITAPRAYSVGQYSIEQLFDIDAADFDGDGHPDFVVGGYQTYFLHGNGDSTFTEAVSTADFGDDVGPVIATDLNSDGKQDIVAISVSLSRSIHTILGNGDGTFQPAQEVSVGPLVYQFQAAVGDFNRDGKPDVALSDFGSETLFILLGKGDGTFQPAITYSTPKYPSTLCTADFNLDGILDLVLSHGAGFSVYLGIGNGTFAPPVTTLSPVTSYPAAADLNNDGKPDVAVGGDEVRVFLGNGDGTFKTSVIISSLSGKPHVADIDSDGRLDLLVTSFGVHTIFVARGIGDGTFRPAVEYDAGLSYLADILVKDLNGDGAPEVTVNSSYASISVLLNTSHR